MSSWSPAPRVYRAWTPLLQSGGCRRHQTERLIPTDTSAPTAPFTFTYTVASSRRCHNHPLTAPPSICTPPQPQTTCLGGPRPCTVPGLLPRSLHNTHASASATTQQPRPIHYCRCDYSVTPRPISCPDSAATPADSCATASPLVPSKQAIVYVAVTP